MTVSAEIAALYAETARFLEDGPAAGQARDFLPEPPPHPPRLAPGSAPPAPPVPGVDLAGAAAQAPMSSALLCRALLAASAALDWRQSYAAEDVGASFAARYGWCALAGPEGPVLWPSVRVCFVYWGPELDYPPHAHTPEELYLPLCGGGVFSADGRAARWAGPGDAVFHPSGLRHATRMGPGGLLCLVLWRGGDLALDMRLTPGGLTPS